MTHDSGNIDLNDYESVREAFNAKLTKGLLLESQALIDESLHQGVTPWKLILLYNIGVRKKDSDILLRVLKLGDTKQIDRLWFNSVKCVYFSLVGDFSSLRESARHVLSSRIDHPCFNQVWAAALNWLQNNSNEKNYLLLLTVFETLLVEFPSSEPLRRVLIDYNAYRHNFSQVSELCLDLDLTDSKNFRVYLNALIDSGELQNAKSQVVKYCSGLPLVPELIHPISRLEFTSAEKCQLNFDLHGFDGSTFKGLGALNSFLIFLSEFKGIEGVKEFVTTQLLKPEKNDAEYIENLNCYQNILSECNSSISNEVCKTELSRDLVIHQVSGAISTILCFTTIDDSLFIPTRFIIPVLTSAGYNVIEFKNSKKMMFLGRIEPLGEHVENITTQLKQVLKRIGTQNLYCIGASGGGYAACLYAALLGAQRAVSFSGTTTVSLNYHTKHDNRAIHLFNRVNRCVDEKYHDLIPFLTDVQFTGVELELYFGNEHKVDNLQAKRLKHFDAVKLHHLPSSSHASFVTLFSKDSFVSFIKEKFK